MTIHVLIHVLISNIIFAVATSFVQTIDFRPLPSLHQGLTMNPFLLLQRGAVLELVRFLLVYLLIHWLVTFASSLTKFRGLVVGNVPTKCNDFIA